MPQVTLNTSPLEYFFVHRRKSVKQRVFENGKKSATKTITIFHFKTIS